MKCCICGEEIVGYGNNALPVAEGRCCDKCNRHVLKCRLMEMGLHMLIAEELQNEIVGRTAKGEEK